MNTIIIVDVIVAELKYFIDMFLTAVREDGGVYWSPFLKKHIKV